ncbi:MAG: hypothetical protein ACRENW_02730 [Thermodesulfobacteriota bacterium]
MATHDDDLEQIPWWDAKALRMVEAIETSIVRLGLESQGEFIAIINAIEVQLESKPTVPEVVRLLVESLRALARLRTLEESHCRQLDQRLTELLDRVSPAPR